MKKYPVSFDGIKAEVSCIRDGHIFGSFTDNVRAENPYYSCSTVVRCLHCGHQFIRHEYSGGEVLEGNQCDCQ